MCNFIALVAISSADIGTMVSTCGTMVTPGVAGGVYAKENFLSALWPRLGSSPLRAESVVIGLRDDRDADLRDALDTGLEVQ